MTKSKDISEVILVGGMSRRMGKDKRYLPWQGVNLLDSVCGLLNTVFEDIIVVTAKPDYEVGSSFARLVTDEIPGKGSMGGLFSGIRHSRHSSCFVVACDMPYLNSEVISRICQSPPADIVVVKLLQGFQPLHARYSKQYLPFLEEMIQSDNLKIQELYSDRRISSCILDETHFLYIDPHLRSFINVNTPADWEFARKAQRNLHG